MILSSISQTTQPQAAPYVPAVGIIIKLYMIQNVPKEIPINGANLCKPAPYIPCIVNKLAITIKNGNIEKMRNKCSDSIKSFPNINLTNNGAVI